MLAAAVISASVALLVAVVTQVWTARIAIVDRRFTMRRQSLIDVQNSALALRDALRRYGPRNAESVLTRPDSRDQPSPGETRDSLDQKRQEATGTLDVHCSRVEDKSVVEAVNNWVAVAEVRFISEDQATASDEESHFDYLQSIIGVALRRVQGVTRDRDRKTLDRPTEVPGLTSLTESDGSRGSQPTSPPPDPPPQDDPQPH